ncbi:MAG: alpha/beta hydrolase [Deltaproteobacteria bacterium]|nr:alpha/beta hydrolase [Deltaproteobacteria bacterium]
MDKAKKVKIKTKDNILLQGEILSGPNPKAVVLINPATATKTSYYKEFAKYLVENGFAVFLWNYRGICISKSETLAGSQYKFSDIGKYDVPAAIDKVSSLFPNLPLLCIGHSAGGQQFGFTDQHKKLQILIAVASSSGYFYQMPFAYRLKALFFFKIFAPISNLFFGYVAASKFKFMEDLPTSFVKEWNQWCSEKELFFSPKYYNNLLPQDAYKNFNFAIHVMTADDDEISTPKNIENFWKNIHSKKGIVFTRYSACNFPNKKIGHFGYFKKSSKRIWEDILKLLNESIS